jgi:hypothetical protein
MATWMVANWGQPEVVAKWCPALTQGQKLASYCLTEPDAGSDAASLTTTARRDGDGISCWMAAKPLSPAPVPPICWWSWHALVRPGASGHLGLCWCEAESAPASAMARRKTRWAGTASLPAADHL